MRKRNPVLAVVLCIAIAVTLLGSLAGCKKEESAQDAPYFQAITKLENTYNGDAKAFETIAPDGAWKYLQRTGLNTQAYLADLQASQASFVNEIRKEYGNQARITVSVSGAEACSQETLEKINKGLNKMYGLKVNDVKQAYRMTRSVKVSGTAEALYEGAELLTVEIDGQWYVVYDHSTEENPVFYFPYLSQKELENA